MAEPAPAAKGIPVVVPPVGSIIAWHKTMGMPSGSSGSLITLPPKWVECNGQTIADPESPFDRTDVPDLNGQGLFVRGAPTSGVTQADQAQLHAHTFTGEDDVTISVDPAGSERVLVEVRGKAQHIGAYMHPLIDGTDHVATTLSFGHAHDFTSRGTISPPEDGGYGSVRIGDETRPANFSVVWIIRIK